MAIIIKLVRFIKNYFMFCGLSLHTLILALYLYEPSIVYAVTDKIEMKVKLAINPNALIDEQKELAKQLNDEIATNFGQWLPLPDIYPVAPGMIKIENTIYPTLADAISNLQDNQTMLIGDGIYREPLVIKKNNVKIIGVGHVTIDEATAEGKAAIITKGNNIFISNIECKNIAVGDANGACIRAENANLTVNHVYFHNSEEGILTFSHSESLHIQDSRFEKLGKNGFAHGVYIGSGELYIDKCLFISSVSEGHEVKSRAKKTVITNSVLASLSGNDSRLIDVPNGGELIISDSILEKGPQSVNSTAIGYGLEGMKHTINKITLSRSVIILERDGFNKLFDIKSEANAPLIANNNIVISKDGVKLEGLNWIYSSRKDAKIASYPTIPVLENNAK
jgi:hypothetical protein